MGKNASGVRYAEVDRETGETRIHVVLDLDGGTRQDIATGIGFFDHMLMQFAFHGQIDLGIKAEGDLHIDDHHTAEDVGITLGKAIKEAIRSSDPIARFASNHTPMDEALALVAIDISGRGQLFWDVDFRRDRIGDLSTESVREFFNALCMRAGITLHVRQVAGENDHHICEAIFKGFGRAFHLATRCSERRGAPSTKGSID
ncbi:MAG TPA: imidazoleglycerol-phosphate dehydratase HisB [Fimbriimonadaceae bacterium]|nr:imidazoleglycerol-phosphate dehydratase HisB [Fimbriimonadaceae bacterium]